MISPLKSLLMMLLVWCILIPSLGQTEYQDSLLNVIESARGDSARFWGMYNLMSDYNLEGSEQAFEVGRDALNLAKSNGNIHWQGRAHYGLGIAHDLAGATDSCLKHQLEARKLFEEEGNVQWIGNTMNSIGVSYFYAGDLVNALKWYLDVLEYWENNGLEDEAAQTINNIGVVYRMQRNYEDAIKIYQKSVSIKEAQGDEKGLANTYNNIGLAYSYLGDEVQALDYLNRALELYARNEMAGEVVSVRASMGIAHFKLNHLTEAESHLANALTDRNLLPQTIELPELLISMGRIKNGLSKYEEALVYFREAWELLENTDRTEALNDVRLFGAESFYAMGDYQSAADWYHGYIEGSYDLMDQKRVEEMEKMRESFNAAEREKELEISQLKLAVEERQKTYLMWGMVLAVVVLLVLTFAVWNTVRSNRKLAHQKGIIQKSLEEKEILMREIHHRVKNNLQVVSSLLSIQSRGIEDAKALEAVNESRNRVKSMALIHQDLYREDDLTHVDVRTYIGKLVESLFSSYRVDQERVKLVKEIDAISLDVDTLIPLGLILNELISNSLKYAFEQNEGTLNVTLKQENGILRLEVSDDGIGLDPQQLEGDGFGMKMIRAFSEKLGASFEVISDHGTTSRLTVKKFKAA
ncbi:MAG: tetratricopeptide repeat protein [Flavobacteriales bacterium]|nr:tetratricopeptide repeat protein [Flavobacteriales bacterium]